ncbi:3022_t:CDS:2 [Acaulospora morrowiae]|uniref:3022_t:CDS:1 n=1 Tax=Acaulospora morrowiae TaxID=94023 RepID=A0A9N9GR70_9GLOM|nr:3022_t:CDS:2 [Acaulospora morrowiae]
MATEVDKELSNEVHPTLTTSHFTDEDASSDTSDSPKEDSYDYVSNYEGPEDLDSHIDSIVTEQKTPPSLSSQTKTNGEFPESAEEGNGPSSESSSNYGDDTFEEMSEKPLHDSNSRTSSTDSFNTDGSSKDQSNISDHTSDTSYDEKDAENDLDDSEQNTEKGNKNYSNESTSQSVINVVKKPTEISSESLAKDEENAVSGDKGDIESVNSKTPKSFSFSSIHHSIDMTNGREIQCEIVEDKDSNNRMSVATLAENPELNDISLDDESLRVEEPQKEWSFNDWSFPKTPTSLKSLSTLFTSRSATSPTPSKNDDRRLSSVSMMSTGSNCDLLLARLDRENQMLQEDPKAKRISLQGIAEIKASFERAQNEASGNTNEEDIDWDFWGQLISDYETVARTQSKQLSKMIQKGIPQTLRGMIWQLMSRSKDSELELTYAQLLNETSSHEKMITRDLKRTFPKHEYFQNKGGQEGLFNVVKAYSIYDKEVGYCQGISFVVGPLLLNMPDEEAFCVLVRLMKFYNIRGHFLPGMDGLQLRLYQFDRLVEEMLPKVHQHLRTQGINSSMYASQWFMTLFAYKFPLSLVYRIYDTIFTEGIESIFRFSIALLKKNEKKLVEMEFERLLEYLKSGLFESYQITPTGVLAQLVPEVQYKSNEFVMDAYNIRITTKKLNKYQQEYYANREAEKKRLMSEAEAMERLKANNQHLINQVRGLEGSLQQLDREHVELANELVNTKVELARLKDENDELHSTVANLRKNLENQLKEEMDSLAKKNVKLVEINNKLEDQVANLENMLIESKMRYAESENEREVLKRKWNDLKKAIG